VSDDLSLQVARTLVSPFEDHLMLPWGRVVTDRRYSGLWDANCAVVEDASALPHLREIEKRLEPAVRQAGARHSHLVIPRPDRTQRLLAQLASSGHRVAWNVVMCLDRDAPQAAPQTIEGALAAETTVFDDRFWRDQRRSFREFGIADPAVVEQLIELTRLLNAAGKRWFEVLVKDEGVALGGLQMFGTWAYIDDVITTPPMRRRGFATGLMRLMIARARDAGATTIVLLVDQHHGPVTLYERLGFRKAGSIASTLKALG
jgi:GNAT superfamily N-acetyltransferase